MVTVILEIYNNTRRITTCLVGALLLVGCLVVMILLVGHLDFFLGLASTLPTTHTKTCASVMDQAISGKKGAPR
jgi:hypothetical protein